MVVLKLEEMNTEELLGVIHMKDSQIKEMKLELAAWQQLVEELQEKYGLNDTMYTGNGD